jgi:PPM family protein phosphatase
LSGWTTEKAPVVITLLYARSDVGNLRSNNEDNFVIADLVSGRAFTAPRSIERKLSDNRLLIAVSDGIGGEQAGEIASALAVYGIHLELLSQQAGLDMVDRLAKAIEKINLLLWNESQNNSARKGMGATLTAAVIDGSRAYIAEIGDSRAYIIRRGKIKQITTDQSLFEMLVESGVYNREQKESTPARNIILQSLGGQAEVKAAISIVDLYAGDYLLLCSDGLSNKLQAKEILEHVVKSPNLESAGMAMIDLAKDRGGEDNITLILSKFEGSGLPRSAVKSSITDSIDIITAFDPLTGEVDRRTKQMVSDNTEQNKEQDLFRSTLTLLPLPDYPERDKAFSECNRAIELIQESSTQLKAVIDQIHNLEKWLQKYGRMEMPLQKATAHLEQAIKSILKVEKISRKTHHLLDEIIPKRDS